MTIAEIINAVRAVAEPWVKDSKGAFSVARDPWHAYELLAAGTSGLILVLCCGGEKPTDAPQGNPLGRLKVELTLGYGMGLTADLQSGQFAPIGNRPPLANMLDSLLQAVCAIDMQQVAAGATGPCFIYEGFDPVSLPNGVRMAAYRCTFHIIRLVRSQVPNDGRAAVQ